MKVTDRNVSDNSTETGRAVLIADVALGIIAGRDVPDLAAFLVEVEHPLPAVVVEVPQPELGDGSGPAGIMQAAGRARYGRRNRMGDTGSR